MDIERILQRFEEHHKEGWGVRSSPVSARRLIEEYQAIPLTLPITDESMKRVCEVLTRAGYTTTESCEGHNRTTPRIFLECPSQYHLRHLTSILQCESREKNFPWDLKTYTGEVFVNYKCPLSYIMSPNLSFQDNNPQDKDIYQKMIDDLDIIGISVLRYFSSVDLQDLEKFRKKVDFKVRTFKIPDVPADFFRD
jgi:hypothetical protein